MLEEKYKAKVEDMQIYVPLLTKLISKLEAKNDESEENVEKISQLKTLLQQLLDPKPGISFEELDECHQVMENMFKSNKSESTKIKSPHTVQINEVKEKGTPEVIGTLPLNSETEETTMRKTIENGENQKIVPENIASKIKIQQFLADLIDKETSIEEQKETDSEHDIKAVEGKNANLEKQNIAKGTESKDKEIKSTTIKSGEKENAKDKGVIQKTNIEDKQSVDGKENVEENLLNSSTMIKETEATVDSFESDEREFENVELIEFSEEEGDESFENEEMILPDDEELLFVDPRERVAENRQDTDSEAEVGNEKVNEDVENESNKSESDQQETEKEDEEIAEAFEKVKEKIKNSRKNSVQQDEKNENDAPPENQSVAETEKQKKSEKSNIYKEEKIISVKEIENENEVDMLEMKRTETITQNKDMICDDEAFDEVQPYYKRNHNECTETAQTTATEDDGEQLMDVDDLEVSKLTTKRASSEIFPRETPKTKKIKIYDPLKDIEIESAIETVTALAPDFLDPLAVDELNLEQFSKKSKESSKAIEEKDVENEKDITPNETINSKNDSTNDKNIDQDDKTEEDKKQDDKEDDKKENDNKPDNDDDDDDVEIIETRNSPILIESDDEDNLKKGENANDNALKSTTQQQPPHKLVISNVKSLNKQSQNSFKTITLQSANTNAAFRKNGNSHSQKRTIMNRHGESFKAQPQRRENTEATANASQTQKSGITDLQPKMISGPNPQLFSTKVGNRNLLIPNAFYGTNKKTTGNITNPDVAHCRWLENFLRNFCSPYNIAHNTCFLLLQRALRADDYALIRQMRLDLNVTKGEIDEELLRSLRGIFYLDAKPENQKLSFIGRKFCNLAFVNILDKTISLTVDWRTNGVTSRTRISAATLEAVRQQKASTTMTELESDLLGTNEISMGRTTPPPLQDISPLQLAKPANPIASAPVAYPITIFNPSDGEFPAVKAFIPIQQTSKPKPVAEPIVDSLQDDIPATVICAKTCKTSSTTATIPIKITPIKPTNVQHDIEYITGDNDDNSAAMTETPAVLTPRRSQRNASRQAKSEITTRFVYSDDDNDMEINDSEADLEFLPEKEDTSKSSSSVDKSPATILNYDLGQVDISAAVKDFPNRKQTATVNATGKKEQEKKNTSFEMAFLNRLAHHDKDAIKRAKQKPKTPTQTSTQNQAIVILDDDEEDDQLQESIATTAKLPLEPRLIAQQRIKNIAMDVHFKGRYADYCLVCKRKVNHIVGHYVNVHPDCEVYMSRPTPAFAVLMMKKQMEIAKYDRERNDASLFVATCVFCEKRGSFSFSYWYQHFASHTGEYAFQCTGCGIRKPSRAHLLQHLIHCQKKGECETTQQYDCSAKKITAYMCLLCNYTQINCANIMKHLICEHGYARVQRDHWTEVTLLEIPQANVPVRSCSNNESKASNASSKTAKVKHAKPGRPKKLNSKTSDYIEDAQPPPILIRNSNGDIFEIAEVDDGKRLAVDLTSNVDPPPFVANEAENDVYGTNLYNNQTDDIGDVEGIIQAYINRKK